LPDPKKTKKRREEDEIQDGLLILRSEEMLRRLSPILLVFGRAMAGSIKGRVSFCFFVFFFPLRDSIGRFVESKNDVKDRPMILK
jgi:hypothetical protein